MDLLASLQRDNRELAGVPGAPFMENMTVSSATAAAAAEPAPAEHSLVRAEDDAFFEPPQPEFPESKALESVALLPGDGAAGRCYPPNLGRRKVTLAGLRLQRLEQLGPYPFEFREPRPVGALEPATRGKATPRPSQRRFAPKPLMLALDVREWSAVPGGRSLRWLAVHLDGPKRATPRTPHAPPAAARGNLEAVAECANRISRCRLREYPAPASLLQPLRLGAAPKWLDCARQGLTPGGFDFIPGVVRRMWPSFAAARPSPAAPPGPDPTAFEIAEPESLDISTTAQLARTNWREMVREAKDERIKPDSYHLLTETRSQRRTAVLRLPGEVPLRQPGEIGAASVAAAMPFHGPPTRIPRLDFAPFRLRMSIGTRPGFGLIAARARAIAEEAPAPPPKDYSFAPIAEPKPEPQEEEPQPRVRMDVVLPQHAIPEALPAMAALPEPRISRRALAAILSLPFAAGIAALTLRQPKEDWEEMALSTSSWSGPSRNGGSRHDPVNVLWPTMKAAAYRVQFRSSAKSVEWLVRMPNSTNYFYNRLTRDARGVRGTGQFVRYAVVNGVFGPQHESLVPLPLTDSRGNLIQVEAKGAEMTLYLDGSQVDHWTDPELTTGGFALAGGSSPDQIQQLRMWTQPALAR